MSGLSAVRLDAGSLDAADRAAWSDLADRAVEPNPFFRPEFVLPSVRHHDVPVELIVVRDETRSRWVACLPVRRKPVLAIRQRVEFHFHAFIRGSRSTLFVRIRL